MLAFFYSSFNRTSFEVNRLFRTTISKPDVALPSWVFWRSTLTKSNHRVRISRLSKKPSSIVSSWNSVGQQYK